MIAVGSEGVRSMKGVYTAIFFLPFKAPSSRNESEYSDVSGLVAINLKNSKSNC